VETGDRRKSAPRSAPDGVYIDCRRCWRHIKLDPTRVEIDSAQVVYRCQNCDATFSIRDSDAAALGVGRPEK
jgi:DNA-directed RNA polymerase subunit RPC12/RpoP